VDPSTNLKPADLMIHGLPDGFPRIVDVSVASCFSNSDADAQLPIGYNFRLGTAVHQREKSKTNKYREVLSGIEAKFVPFVLNGAGFAGKSARSLLAICRDAIAERYAIPSTSATKRVYSFLWSSLYKILYSQAAASPYLHEYLRVV